MKKLLLLPMWAIVSFIISCTQDSMVDNGLTEVDKHGTNY